MCRGCYQFLRVLLDNWNCVTGGGLANKLWADGIRLCALISPKGSLPLGLWLQVILVIFLYLVCLGTWEKDQSPPTYRVTE